MNRCVPLLILIAAGLMTGGCGESAAPGKPDLPQSVTPGWTLRTYEPATAPEGLPNGATKPTCWKADYASKGSAVVWLCGYSAEGGAFDAVQRARAEADTVKFQEGRYLVIAKWQGVPMADVTALVRTLQKRLQSK